MYWSDLRAFLQTLDDRGKLYRFHEPIDKDSELLPLHRVQLRGLAPSQRKVLLFEQVRNAAGEDYDMRVVAGVYGVSEEVVALGMGCESPQECLEKWHWAVEHPIPPELVPEGPVQEEVHQGHELSECGLDELPVPLEDPGFGQMIRTGLPVITRDPETGNTNVGTYNAFFRDRARLIVSGGKDSRKHWQAARRRNEDLPAAIVIGATPNLMLVGGAALPYGADELAVAGGIAACPVELVRCKTVPLEVPAHAEAVIEGLVSTRVQEPRLPFGEYVGYFNMDRELASVMTVTAITHRHDAIFTPVPVGFAPNDGNAVWAVCNAAMLYHYLRYGCRLPVAEVYIPETAGGKDLTIIRLEKDAQREAGAQALQVASGLWHGSKYLVTVDYDIDPRDPDLLIWALSYRVRPETDISILRGRSVGLDPTRSTHRLTIDATMRGPYPPVALPRRDFMERALEIWLRHSDLPEPILRDPWHGYTLGMWSNEDQELADLLVRGDYKAVGRITARKQATAERLEVGS